MLGQQDSFEKESFEKERKRLDERLSELYGQRSDISAAIQRLERRRDTVLQREAHLRQQCGMPPPSREGTTHFELGFAENHLVVDRREDGAGHHLLTTPGNGVGGDSMDEWEDCLGAVGIAKCGECGMRLPLETHAIDQHSRECGC